LPLILLLVLVPAIATAVLLLGSGGGRVAKGAQPGGLVRGVVRAAGGTPRRFEFTREAK